MTKQNNKVIVILGPTASGKTGLGVDLACKFNGEIISADSRQVYKYMNIGTGKDLDEYTLQITNYKLQITNKIQNPKSKIQKKYKIVKTPYHLIDVVHPNTEFNLVKYQRLAYKAIDDILGRGKLPIIAGGSALYLQAVVDNYNLSKVKPDSKLREELEKLDIKKLYKKLKVLNKSFATELNNSEKNNKRRLIRYIEVSKEAKLPAGGLAFSDKYDFLLLGLTWPREVLRNRIYKRLIERLEKEDMIGEVERLHKKYRVSWKRLESFGLEYKFISFYLRGKLDYDEMVEKLNIAIGQFAKRQMSWFRRWERQEVKINWVKDKMELEKLARKFLK